MYLVEHRVKGECKEPGAVRVPLAAAIAGGDGGCGVVVGWEVGVGVAQAVPVCPLPGYSRRGGEGAGGGEEATTGTVGAGGVETLDAGEEAGEGAVADAAKHPGATEGVETITEVIGGHSPVGVNLEEGADGVNGGFGAAGGADAELEGVGGDTGWGGGGGGEVAAKVVRQVTADTAGGGAGEAIPDGDGPYPTVRLGQADHPRVT